MQDRRDLPATVVIPTWQRPEWLQKCIAAVEAQQPAPERILVVGRNEDAESRNVVAAAGRKVDWAEVSVPGHVDPIRVAKAQIRSEVVIVIDDDALPTNPNWAQTLVSSVMRDGVACVGSKVEEMTNVTRRVRRNAGRITWYGRPIGNVAARDDRSPFAVDGLPEGNWAWRADVLKSLEVACVFDLGDGALYGVDLCQQAKRLGWQVEYFAGAPVNHYSAPRAGVAARSDRAAGAYSYARNLTFIAFRHFGWRRPVFLVWSTLLGDSGIYGLASAVLALLRGRASWPVVLASFRGRVAGVREWRASVHPPPAS